MTESLPERIQTLLAEATGEGIVVGRRCLAVHTAYGALLVPLEEAPLLPAPRPRPVLARPRPLPGLLGRARETAAAAAAFANGRPLNVYGPPGVGKTALLRHLAYETAHASLPGGVVYLSGHGASLGDLCQALFDAFFPAAGGTRIKPDAAQLHEALSQLRAFVLLDDVELPRRQVEALLEAAPACVFAVASTRRCLWGDVRALELAGLPPHAAVELLERELERPLAPEEAESATELAEVLQGHPLRLLQAAAAAREEGLALVEVAQRVLAAPAAERPVAVVGSPGKEERLLLAALAAVGGGPLSSEALTVLAGLADAEGSLEAVHHRRLVEVQGTAYRLAGDLPQVLEHAWSMADWRQRALAYFLHRSHGESERLAGSEAAVEALLAWALEAGHWEEAVRLARALERSLFAGGRWGAWRRVLEAGQRAGEAAGDERARAWNLAQLGTRGRALAAGEEAGELLRQAAGLYEALGAETEAALARHNLALPLPEAPLHPAAPAAEEDRDGEASAAPEDRGGREARPTPRGADAYGTRSISLAGLHREMDREEMDRRAASRGPAEGAAPGAGDVDLWRPEGGGEAEEPTEDLSPPPEEPTPSTKPEPAEPTAAASGTAGEGASEAEGGGAEEPTTGDGYLDWELDRSPPPGRQRGGEEKRSAPWKLGLAVLALAVVAVAGWFLWPRNPSFTLEPAPGLDFGDQPLNAESDPLTVTLLSDGGREVVIAAVRLSGEHVDDFVPRSDTCSGATLEPEATCSVEVTFTPGGEGPRAATLAVEAETEGLARELPLLGAGIRPQGRLLPDRVDFGRARAGRESSVETLVLANTGLAPLNVTSIALSRGTHFSVAGDACTAAPVPAGGECTLEVTFAPRAAGRHEVELRIEGDSLEAPVVGRLTGEGTEPRLTLGAPSLGFGATRLGTRGERTLRLTNNGTATLAVARVQLGGGAGTFSLTGDTCTGKALEPGASCTVGTRFTPAAEGDADAALTITADAPGGPWSVPLAGTGTAPHIAAEPRELAFGGQDVGEVAPPRSVRLENTGSAPLTVGELAFAGDRQVFSASEDGCSGETLEPGQECQLTFLFRPPREQRYGAELIIPSDAVEGDLTLLLSGAGTAPHVAAEPSALDFGDERVESMSRPLRLTLESAGTAPLRLAGVGLFPEDGTFTLADDRCSGQVLPPGAACTLIVRFRPPREGTFRAELRAASNAREGTQRVALSGEGVAPRAAVEPRSLDFGLSEVGIEREPMTLAVESAGSVELRVGQVAVSGERTSFPIEGNECTETTLAPGRRCRITVGFTPAAEGPHEAVVRIEHDGADSPAEVRIRGTGTPPRDRQPPTPPTGLAPGNPDPQRPRFLDRCRDLVLTWQPVSDPSAPVTYAVVLEAESEGAWTRLATLPAAEPRAEVGAVVRPRLAHRWAVRARDDAGNESAASDWHYFTCVSRLP